MTLNQNQGYDFKPFRNSSHEKILRLVEPGKEVLDIGCAEGHIAARLSERNCIVTGIDNNRAYLKLAKKYCKKVILADISKEKISGKYDIIILGDILEHLPEPFAFLSSLKSNLKENGYIIVSVPNIANFYPRIKILFGHFDYENRGIFDRTHLRFFTLKSFKKLIFKSGYKIESFESTSIPFQLAFPGLSKSLLTLANYFFGGLSKLWPTMFGYQFVAKIR